MCFGRPSSRPYSYAVEHCGDLQCIINDCPYSHTVGLDMIYNVLSMTVHAGSVGASGSSPALRPPMTYMVGIPLRGYAMFSYGLCFGRPSSRPYSYAAGYAVICNALLMIVHAVARWSIDVIFRALSRIVHAGNVGASGSSPALRLRW